MSSRLASAILLLGACTTPAPIAESNLRGNYRHTENYLAWRVDRVVADNEITGISIALIDDQKVI